jgi:hypothetical protein
MGSSQLSDIQVWDVFGSSIGWDLIRSLFQVLSYSSIFDMDVKEQPTWTYLRRCGKGAPGNGDSERKVSIAEYFSKSWLTNR